MDQVSMNDGLEGRETLAFGLAAGEVVVFVLALMSAYAVLRSELAGPVAWTLAALLVGGGAILAWGRLAGRPLIEWVGLLASFVFRTRHARAATVRARLIRWSTASSAVAVAAGARLRSRAAPARSAESGAVVIPLALRRRGRGVARGVPPEPVAATGRCRVVGFFSLAGGTGRTTLAVEVATILALRGRVATATGEPTARVVLLDLARRNPTVGLCLGMPAPSIPGGPLIAHPSGLLVGLAAASALPLDGDDSPPGSDVIDGQECTEADIVIVDFDCDLGAECTRLLRRCDRVLVTLTPTARGVLDAYRSTALLRRLGLRDRIGHVVNRCQADVDLDEAMADLGGVIAVEIPHDAALADAEHHHRCAGLDDGGAASAALNQLATYAETGDIRSAPGVPRWGSHAG